MEMVAIRLLDLISLTLPVSETLVLFRLSQSFPLLLMALSAASSRVRHVITQVSRMGPANPYTQQSQMGSPPER